MTPTQLETTIRQRYNAVSDNFWSSSEILGLVQAACAEMAREAGVIERVYTTSTVASQQEYSYPTETIAIKRITYNGQKLQPITQREDDQVTGMNQSVTTEGTPLYYYVWNEVLYLRPIPAEVGTLKIYSINEPQDIAVTSVLEVPSIFHIDIVDYVLSAMHAKEKNFDGAGYYQTQWEKKLQRIKAWQRKRLRSDAFANVNDIDSMSESFIGSI